MSILIKGAHMPIDGFCKDFLVYSSGRAEQYDARANLVATYTAEEQTAQPERKKGKWEMKWHSFFERKVPTCSACDAGSFFDTNYCPHCSADMRGKQDEAD